MTWMGLDIGTRRIGVALSDSGGSIAQPHTTLDVDRGGAIPFDELRALAVERSVGGVVVGLPRRLDGSRGPECERVEAIAAEVAERLGVAVELWDERLTSVEAERLLIEAGVRRRKRRGATDRMAAALILQGYLDRRAMEAAIDEGA